MNSAAGAFRITLQVGDVVQIGRGNPASNEIRWSSPRVVMGVGSKSIYASEIYTTPNNETLLTTISTERGIVRPVEGATPGPLHKQL